MRFLRFGLLSFAALVLALPVVAQKDSAADEAAVRAVLSKQAADWNRGDMNAFETGYKNSPDILFIGNTVRRGYAEMQQAYAKGYETPAKMGRLSFNDLEVHLLDARFATVLGRFHLERTAEGGGSADGIFSLIFEKTPAGWKIILDHTSNTPSPPVTH